MLAEAMTGALHYAPRPRREEAPVRKPFVIACALAALCGTGRVSAQEPAAPSPFEPSFGASMTFASAFVWRGFVLGSDPAVQPSVWARVGPVTVTSWSNTYLPSPSKLSYSEHDLSVDYAWAIGGATLSFGWINYAYAHVPTGRYSNEFYAAVAGGGYLSPKLQVFQDVHQGSGTYAMLAVSHEYALASTAARLTPTFSVGYNHHQWTDRSGFSDVTAALTLSVPTPIRHLALQPFAGYSCGLEAAVFPRRFYGGVTLAVE